MRYNDFKIVEAIPTDDAVGNKMDKDNSVFDMEGGLESGPPYPQDQVEAVKELQTELERLGYSVGSTGIDGKYGPRTSRAVKAYQRDFGQATPTNANYDGGAITADAIAALKTASPVDDPTPTGNSTGDPRVAGGDPNFVSPGYPPEMTRSAMESIIAEEAKLRNIDVNIAIRIFRAEGAGAYQSQIPRTGRGSLGGKEASFGPFQLYIGNGLGNVYQDTTGRDLTKDNTVEGITNQIRFALDQAVTGNGWQPWSGRVPAGVAQYAGLGNARAIENWA
jgi:peptidoglycan hydrolase-like protein with peptidoglycan-binding domain